MLKNKFATKSFVIKTTIGLFAIICSSFAAPTFACETGFVCGQIVDASGNPVEGAAARIKVRGFGYRGGFSTRDYAELEYIRPDTGNSSQIQLTDGDGRNKLQVAGMASFAIDTYRMSYTVNLLNHWMMQDKLNPRTICSMTSLSLNVAATRQRSVVFDWNSLEASNRDHNAEVQIEDVADNTC